MQSLSLSIASYVKAKLLPELRDQSMQVMGKTGQWKIDPQREETLLFFYPTMLEHEYIAPVVRIEMGGNADGWPTSTCSILSYVQQEFPDLIEGTGTDVVTVDIARNFWEKISILHKIACRLEENPLWNIPERYSRHYYDVYRLSQAGIVQAALSNSSLISDVRRAAQIFFEDRKAKYEEFAQGSIRLLPPESGIQPLTRDYSAMRDMIFGEYPPITAIFEELQSISNRVNSST